MFQKKTILQYCSMKINGIVCSLYSASADYGFGIVRIFSYGVLQIGPSLHKATNRLSLKWLGLGGGAKWLGWRRGT
jgi:hypothetical protein